MIEFKWDFPFKIDAPTQRIGFFMNEKKPLCVSISGPNVVKFHQSRRLPDDPDDPGRDLEPYFIFEVTLTGPIVFDRTHQRLGNIRELMIPIIDSLVIPAGVFDTSRTISLRRDSILFCSELHYVSCMDEMSCCEAAFRKHSNRSGPNTVDARLVMCTDDDPDDCIVLQFEAEWCHPFPCDFVNLALQHVQKFTCNVRLFIEYIACGVPTETGPDSPARWMLRHGYNCVKAFVTGTVRADATLPQAKIYVELMVEQNGLPST